MLRGARVGWAGHLLVALVVTLPPIGRPSTLIGNGNVDVWNHAWGPWWWWTALSSGTLPYHTELLHYPDGGVLWFIDPVLALLGAPLVPLLGLAGTWNTLMVAYVAFASWAAHRFARALGANGWAAWTASGVFAASAWMVCELHNGISEAVNIGWVALALAWTEDAARAKTTRAWAKAGLGVGLSALASPYLGLGTGLAAAVRGLPSIKTALVGAVVAVVVAAPGSMALRHQLEDARAIVKHPASMNDELAAHNAVDPQTFVRPGGFQSVDLSNEGFAHSMYLGLLSLGLCAVALRRRGPAERLWLLAAGVCLLVSLGPYLFFDGAHVALSDGRRFRLPWAWVQQLVPGLAVTHPLRLAVPALAIVAGLAAMGLPSWLRGPKALIALACVMVDGLWVSGAPWPVAQAPLDTPEVYETMARADDEPVQWGILDLPTDAGATMATSRYLAWQSVHRRPIPYGPDARASTSALMHVPAFRVLAALSRRRPDEDQRLGLGRLAGPTPHPRSLREFGYRWIVVHRSIDPVAADAITAALTQDLGPGSPYVDGTVWDLGVPDTTPRKSLPGPAARTQ